MYRVNNKEFLLLTKYKHFLNDLDDIVENVPRKDFYFKDRIRNTAIDVLENILYLNHLQSANEEIVAKIKSGISLLDFLIDRLYEKRYASEKAIYKLATNLTELNKMASGWIKSL